MGCCLDTTDNIVLLMSFFEKSYSPPMNIAITDIYDSDEIFESFDKIYDSKINKDIEMDDSSQIFQHIYDPDIYDSMDIYDDNQIFEGSDYSPTIEDIFDISFKLIDQKNHDEDIINVYFYLEAITTLKNICNLLYKYDIIEISIYGLRLYELSSLDNNFDRKMAYYVINHTPIISENTYTITSADVAISMNTFLLSVINNVILNLPPEDTIKNMLDGYPISLLSKVTNISPAMTHAIGECVKLLVISINPIDELLINITETYCEEFTDNEITALLTYLGTRRRIYVRILIGCLKELHSQLDTFDVQALKQFPNEVNMELEICKFTKLCNSAWLHLLLTISYDNYINSALERLSYGSL